MVLQTNNIPKIAFHPLNYNQKTITTIVLLYIPGLGFSFRQRRNVGYALHTFLVSLDGATENEM
jgi:hypothetical protein